MTSDTLRKINIALDIAAIIALLLVGYYIYSHLGEVRLMLSDPCQVCRTKIGTSAWGTNGNIITLPGAPVLDCQANHTVHT